MLFPNVSYIQKATEGSKQYSELERAELFLAGALL